MLCAGCAVRSPGVGRSEPQLACCCARAAVAAAGAEGQLQVRFVASPLHAACAVKLTLTWQRAGAPGHASALLALRASRRTSAAAMPKLGRYSVSSAESRAELTATCSMGGRWCRPSYRKLGGGRPAQGWEGGGAHTHGIPSADAARATEAQPRGLPG